MAESAGAHRSDGLGALVETRGVVTDAEGRSTLRALPLANLGTGEALIELIGCGLCGTDLYKIDQRRTQRLEGTKPVVLGHEVVGRVLLSAEHSVLPVGKRVAVAHHVACGRCALCAAGAETNCPEYRRNLLSPGGFSEKLLLDARAVKHSAFVLPDAISDASAVFLEPVACVLRGISKANLSSEIAPRVVILGCGSMGLLHLLVLRQLARASRGNEGRAQKIHVEMVDPDSARRQRAEALGADVVRAPTNPASEQDGPGFDAVFDTVGSQQALDQAFAWTRPGGTVVLFAHSPAGQRSELDHNEFFRTERRLVATYSSGRLELVRSYEMLCSPGFDPGVLVTHVVGLSEFDRAISLATSLEALKVVLQPDSSDSGRSPSPQPEPLNSYSGTSR